MMSVLPKIPKKYPNIIEKVRFERQNNFCENAEKA
jgi:hypothetical protein